MIKPTIGRVMWYWPEKENRGDQPLCALVVYVHGDHLVNLAVFGAAGDLARGRSVPIVQDGSPYTAGDSPYCEWMPYQKGQAAKTEEAERGAAAKLGAPKDISASDAAIEKEIQGLGLNAPRLTPQLIASKIKREVFWRVPATVMTVCALELMNGYVVIGTSAPVSSENFNEEMGRKIAREKATDQIWGLEGYLLRQALYANEAAGR